MTTYGFTWKLIREDTGSVIHTGITTDQEGLGEQIKNAIETSPPNALKEQHGSGLRLLIWEGLM